MFDESRKHLHAIKSLINPKQERMKSSFLVRSNYQGNFHLSYTFESK